MPTKTKLCWPQESLVWPAFAALLTAVLVAACSGNGGGANATAVQGPVASYNEKCPECGMQWNVTLMEASSVFARVQVVVENTGERGSLELVFDDVVGFGLNRDQAAAWRAVYLQARAQRNLAQTLGANTPSRIRWRPSATTKLPFTLKTGQPGSESWLTLDRSRPYIGLNGEVRVTTPAPSSSSTPVR